MQIANDRKKKSPAVRPALAMRVSRGVSCINIINVAATYRCYKWHQKDSIDTRGHKQDEDSKKRASTEEAAPDCLDTFLSLSSSCMCRQTLEMKMETSGSKYAKEIAEHKLRGD